MTTGLTAPQRLYLMQVATLPPTHVPAVCYLVQTDDGGNILIDSGLPDRALMPPDLSAVEMGESVVEQLAQIGLEPKDINQLICTHFDLDHAGHHDAFSHAEFIVQRSHYEHARSNPRFAFNRLRWDQPDIRYRFLEGDSELLPGLRVIETSGHVRGHQSVLVSLPKTGAVLLAIDAVPEQCSFTLDRAPSPMDEDAEGVRASTLKLLDLVAREKVALVVFGHDAEQWQTLKKAPAYLE